MSDYKVKGSDLTSIANAIRTAGETSASLTFPDGFVEAIGNISGGGGGAKNLVTGTFTGETSGAAMDVQIPYEGAGYPVMIAIYPSVGAYKSGSDFLTTVQQYAIDTYLMAKGDISLAPNYNGSAGNDIGNVVATYKSSTSDATAINCNRSASEDMYRQNAATGTYATAVRVKSATVMSVYIAGTSNYGFMDGIEYTYQIIYSE